jgi:hypothetical protein
VQLGENRGRVAVAVDATQALLRLVVGDQGLGLVVVNREPLSDGRRVIVVASHKRRAVEIADAGARRRAIVDVVLVSVFRADAAARKTPDQEVVEDVDQYREPARPSEPLELRVQRVRLLDGPG